MKYEEALALVQEEYETKRDSDHSHVICTGLTYNGCEGFCVVLYKDANGEAIITDMGETKEVFSEVPEKYWINLCKKAKCEFRHWSIVRKFRSIDDLDKYIRFLDKVSDRFCGL